jgi:hypothetical protein
MGLGVKRRVQKNGLLRTLAVEILLARIFELFPTMWSSGENRSDTNK